MEQLGVIEILEAFGVVVDDGGGADFVELVYRLNAWERWHGGKPAPLNKIANEMAKQRGLYPQQFYGRMRRAILPVLEADAYTLEAFGIKPEKRTSGKMAQAFAVLRRQIPGGG